MRSLSCSSPRRSARYGLGVDLSTKNGHTVVSHTGEVAGFVSRNTVYPDDKIAVAVLTNEESDGAINFDTAISKILLPQSIDAPAGEVAKVKKVIAALQKGVVDRALFTKNLNFYFTKIVLDDYARSLQPLGPVERVTQSSTFDRGGMTYRGYEVSFGNGRKLWLSTYIMRDGKFDQFLMGDI